MTGAYRNASLNGMSAPTDLLKSYKNAPNNSHPTQQHQLTPIGGASCYFKSPNSQQLEEMVNEIVHNGAAGQSGQANPMAAGNTQHRGSNKHNREKLNTQQYDSNAPRRRGQR